MGSGWFSKQCGTGGRKIIVNALFTPLLGVFGNDLWYAVPLVIVISLVYAGTRHEKNEYILAGAVRFGAWIFCFMFAIFLILAVMSWYA